MSRRCLEPPKIRMLRRSFWIFAGAPDGFLRGLLMEFSGVPVCFPLPSNVCGRITTHRTGQRTSLEDVVRINFAKGTSDVRWIMSAAHPTWRLWLQLWATAKVSTWQRRSRCTSDLRSFIAAWFMSHLRPPQSPEDQGQAGEAQGSRVPQVHGPKRRSCANPTARVAQR